jgi:hypothetical protein
MNFWFEFLDIFMNEQATTCCDCHGFKCQNTNISLILIGFVYDSTPFWLVGLWLHPIQHYTYNAPTYSSCPLCKHDNVYFVWFGEWRHLVLPSILIRFRMLAKKSTWGKGWCIGSLSSWELFNYFNKCDFK